MSLLLIRASQISYTSSRLAFILRPVDLPLIIIVDSFALHFQDTTAHVYQMNVGRASISSSARPGPPLRRAQNLKHMFGRAACADVTAARTKGIAQHASNIFSSLNATKRTLVYKRNHGS